MKRSLPRYLFATAALPVLVLSAPSARAQADKAGAEALLNEAVRLTSAHDYEGACPKFEESLRLYASLNTEYFLADCYEHSGKMASAWVDYLEVAEKARAAGETQKELKARERAHKIEARVAHLTIQVNDSSIADLTIHRDGIDVGRGQWGIPMPVDSGEHSVVASAPGRVAATLRVTVKGDADRETVIVPSLESVPSAHAAAPPAPPPAEAAPPEPSPPPSDASTGSGQRVAGVVLGLTGLVAFAVGEALGVSANASYKNAPGCSGTVCQSESSVATRNSARNLGNIATVLSIAGAAVAVGGGVLWLTAPRTSKPAGALTQRDLRVGVVPGAFVLGGRF